ncbi:MAG: hypothetical protein ABIM89_14960 [Mycobacteriales bacterium]
MRHSRNPGHLWHGFLPSALLLAAGCGRGNPELLTDANGKRVTEGIASLRHGPAHCEWESATFVYFEGQQYIADPDGKIGASTAGYERRASLPTDATDTGYRSGRTRLYVAADKAAVYLVHGSAAERLPVVTPMVGCT